MIVILLHISVLSFNLLIAIADVDGFSGRAADIWALGVTLYCMIYNHLPFFDENEFGIIQKIHK